MVCRLRSPSVRRHQSSVVLPKLSKDALYHMPDPSSFIPVPARGHIWISVGTLEWARLGSNQRPTGYEPVALPLSYRPANFSLYTLHDGVKEGRQGSGSFGYAGSGVSPLTPSWWKGRFMVRQAHHERVAPDNRETLDLKRPILTLFSRQVYGYLSLMNGGPICSRVMH